MSEYFEEYIEEIMSHLEVLEVDPDIPYYSKLKIDKYHRFALVDWLIEIHNLFDMSRATLFRGIHILDRFLTRVEVPTSKLQLVGCTCMSIASKYEDVDPPEFIEFCYIADDSFTVKDMIEMEALICNKLKFRFSLATSFDFTQRFLHFDVAFKEEIYFFLKLALLEPKCLEHKVSAVAASAAFLAFKKFNLEWDADMVDLVNYEESEIKECYMLIYSLYRKERNMLKENKGKTSKVSAQHYSKIKNSLL